MFGLANGWLALGALGGAIPVIIHLLNRRRFRVVRWAAMEFLLASLRKNYRRVRMENLLLLILRVLIIMLMAVALARPLVGESGLLGALGTESRHVVLVLDDSLSMHYREGRVSSFERARDIAGRILGALHKGDVVSLLAMSDVTRPLIKEASLDIELARREVRRLKPGWGGTGLREALVQAAELVASTHKPRKDVFILTDLQAGAWGRKSDAPGAELRSALDRIREEAKVFVVDVGADRPDNLAVTRLAPRFKVVGTGSATEFDVEVVNFGRTTVSGVQVQFLVDKFSQDTKTLDLLAGKAAVVSFSHAFQKKGAHLVQVRIGDDRLKADNVRHLAVNVEDSVPVLLVNGETAQEIDENETYFLERALRPPTPDGAPRPSHLAPTTITEFGLSGAVFEKYRLVVLANLASLAAENAVLRLEDYVRQGGALIVFLGDRVDAAFYNEQLFKGGRGLLPARLGPEVGSIGEDKKGINVELVKPVYPAFEFFQNEMALLLNKIVLFYRYVRLEPPKQSDDVRLIARFDGGDPAILEKTFGRGKVVLFASTCDAEWNNFGPAGALPIAMQELASYLASGDLWQRNIVVRQAYRRTFTPEELVVAVTIRPPGEASAAEELRPYQVGGSGTDGGPAGLAATEIRFTKTETAGPYDIELVRQDGGKQPVEYFAVNSPADESDLRRLTVDAARQVIDGFDFTYATGAAQLELAVSESRASRDLSRSLLMAVLVMACIELILAQRFGR